MTKIKNYYCPQPTGFSMIEVIVSTLLVGIVLVTALNSVGGAIKTWKVSDDDIVGYALAHELLSEIMTKSYNDPEDPNDSDFGPDAGEPSSRFAFDDVDDYDDWSESPPANMGGTALAGFAGWQRSVKINQLRWDDPSKTRPDNEDEGVKCIEVKVTHPNGTTTKHYAIRSKDGSLEQLLGASAQVVTGVAVQLSVGTQSPVDYGTNLLNHAQGP